MFSLVLPSRPCLTTITPLPSSPNGNQFAFSFPLLPRFSHVVVFLNPGVVLPEGVAAGVYLKLPEHAAPQTFGGGEDGAGFRFLGALANEKPSAVFKVNLPVGLGEGGMGGDGRSADGGGEVTVGISVEPVANIQEQLLQLQHSQPQSPTNVHGQGYSQQQQQQPPTKVLAQRIIKNAFNFLAGFSGRVGEGGIEVVPLKSFEEWWRKFERRVEVDPGFLERDEEG